MQASSGSSRSSNGGGSQDWGKAQVCSASPPDAVRVESLDHSLAITGLPEGLGTVHVASRPAWLGLGPGALDHRIVGGTYRLVSPAESLPRPRQLFLLF